MPISVLPDHVVAQIAAGEVVERPASVVKELIENALDAGAATVSVAAAGGGRRLIRVSDDGSGISSKEVELAFARHATSKLRTADDLSHLETLGFRGEALCSIAAVSQVTCLSRSRDETTGVKLVIEGSEVVMRSTVGAPAGTIITVENLFYNVPARLKFLKAESTERRLITQMVMQLAMAFPSVRFVLEHDGREAFRSTGSGSLEDVVVAAYGVDTVTHMLPVDSSGGTIAVRGLTSSPEVTRTDRSRIHIFVNGRVVHDTSLTYAITQAYTGVLESGQYPTSIVKIALPTEDVDINVHPTKAEVRFRDPSAVFAVTQRAIREAVGGMASTRRDGGWHDAGRSLFGTMRTQTGGGSASLPQRDEADDVQPRTVRESTESPAVIDELSPERPRTLPVLRVVGQMGARYIVAEGPAGMYLIDQHAAHARVLYGQLIDAIESDALQTTEEIVGTAHVTAAQLRMIEQAETLLERCGVACEPFGPQTVRVVRAPDILSGVPADEVVAVILDTLNHDDPQDRLIRGLAHVGAVRTGQVLAMDQMQQLVRLLERTPEPLVSPIGTPTLLHLSSDQLSREFGRRGGN
ncbi:MAG: DNA mismatch repair endonuclease MutL [Chloroflexi bacterium]|nr:DNA mismatch repair endonuclease MutL [Chloroflexota bacterium]